MKKFGVIIRMPPQSVVIEAETEQEAEEMAWTLIRSGEFNESHTVISLEQMNSSDTTHRS